jgi:molybdopterin molybdotransferase
MKELLNLIPLAEAQRLALSHIKPLSGREQIKTYGALGRISAQEIHAPADLPGFARSGMDGYAVRATDTRTASPDRPVRLKLMGRIAMGDDPATIPLLGAQEALEIPTGGPLPPGSDTVVILEETTRTGSTDIDVFRTVHPGEHVIAADEDLRRGELVHSIGHRLRPQDLGVLTALGIVDIEVIPHVRVGIISTGDELVPPESLPKPGQVRDVNSSTLQAQLTEMGARPMLHGIIPDDEGHLRQAIESALEESDLLLISGGSSVGKRDLTAKLLSELGEVLVHGLLIRPGKPTIFAMAKDIPVVGLPGNPASSMVVAEVFVGPLIRTLSGAKDVHRRKPLVRARLAEAISSEVGRVDFVRVQLEERDSQHYARPIYAHTTHIASLSRADGLLEIPAESSGLAAGSDVWVELW